MYLSCSFFVILLFYYSPTTEEGIESRAESFGKIDFILVDAYQK